MMKYISFGFTLALLFFVSAPATYAKDLYIDFTNGSSAADCLTESSSCNSFSIAESVVEPGDDIFVAGTSTSGVSLNNNFRGTNTNQLTIQQWTGHSEPTITVSSPDVYGLNITGDYVTINDFNINSSDNVTILRTTANNTTFENNTLSGGLFTISMSGNNNTLEGNTISSGIFGITVTGDENAITRNAITCAIGATCNTGINLTSATTTLVANNIVYNFLNALVDGLNATALSADESSSNSVIANNTLFNNKLNFTLGTATSSVLFNNVVYLNSGQYAYSYLSSGKFRSAVNADYNDYYQAGTGSAIGFVDTGTTLISSLTDWRTATSFDTNSINTDPLFNDTTTTAPNLDLTSESKAIDAGQDLAYVIEDINGKERPVGDASDMGAYEYGSNNDAVEVTAPENVFSSSIKARKATIGWTAATGLVSHYEVRYSYKKTFKKKKLATDIATTSYTIKKRKSNKKTWYQVRTAYVSEGTTYYSEWTEAQGFLTKPTAAKSVAKSNADRLEKQSNGSYRATVHINYKKKKTHPRKKLKVIVNLKTKKGKKVKFQKEGKKLKTTQRFNIKKKGSSQEKEFIIPAQYAGKQLKWSVRIQRNKNKRSGWKKSKLFTPSAIVP